MKKKTNGSDLITKDYLDGALNQRFEEFEARIDGRFEEFEGRLDRKIDTSITDAMDKFYTRIDPILAEIENVRIDRELTTEKLNDHEKRIKKLERN